MRRDEPIRVLRVIARLNVGGPALHVSYLTHGLVDRGYETTLIAGSVGSDEASMEYAARELGVEPVLVEALGREIVPRRDFASVLRLRSLIRQIRPHVLHTHTAKAGAVGRSAAVLAGDARPPAIVHTFHGHVLRGYFDERRSEHFRRVEQELARTSTALVAVSPHVRDDLVRLGVAPPGKIAVIRLGLDLERRTGAPPGARLRTRRELGVDDDTVVIGWFGRMTEIKRVDRLLEALARIPRDRPAAFVLVGDGPLRSGLEQEAAELGIAERCRFLGYREDVAALYAATDVVALSSANEGTPVSLIEALAAGRPVVSTEVGGVPDVVDDGVTGFLVPADDVDAFAERLTLLVDDGSLRARLGEGGRSRVVDRYSVPRLVDDVDRLYRSLLERRGPRRHVGITAPLAPVVPGAAARNATPPLRHLRIALVSQYFPPEVGATQTRIQAFAEYLADRGHDVTVIAEFPNHPHGVIPESYRGRLVVDDRSNAYRVLRVWVKANTVKTQRTRMSFYLSYTAMATACAPLLGRVDVVVATTPPLFGGLAGMALARVTGAAFVLDVRDLWPAAAVSLNQIPSEWAVRTGERLERLLYAGSDRVTAVTAPFCRHIDRIAGRPGHAVLVPNGTLDLFFDALDGPRDRLGVPEDRLLVTFAGTLGIAQALPSVLRAAESMDDGMELAFVGDGPAKAQLIQEAAALGLRNVTFHDARPISGIVPLLAGSDVLLVTLSAHPTFEDFVPSKLIDFMAVGRPVVLAAAGEAARLLEAAAGGLVVTPEDPDALVAALRWLREHPVEAERMGESGRRFARRRLRSVQAERLEVVLDSVARRSCTGDPTHPGAGGAGSRL